mmetsp:Transcript_49991/g.58343  ORF Transcript_49991/g.58343 Transcript_49991/m.58343 type:complete len:253 (-) Transcript_49991:450-1208(-)
MCDISDARPLCSQAATESPPPIIVIAPVFEMSARISTIPNVPLLNASNSKTPMGPFMMTVLQSARAAFWAAVESGPLSRPIQPSGISRADTTCVLASLLNASAMTISVGRMISFPSFSALAKTCLAVSTKSSSTRDVPTPYPWAFKKVKTIPPPMITLSHFSRRASRTVIFDETLDPPTMAAMGFSPLEMAPSRYSSSLARRNPDTAGERNLVTPSVEACARWAVPKASFTKRSNGAASFSTNPGSFLVSSL